MLVKEVIQRIQSAYSKGVQSDDSRLTSKHIYNVLLTQRTRLIVQQAKKKQRIGDWNYVVLSCVELIEVPSHECSCLADLGCSVLRTKYKLPKTLTDLNKHLIQWVLSIDSTLRIDEVLREEFFYQAGNKYTSKKPRYILENEYLYFPLPDVTPHVVKIKLLAEDPIEAYNYPSLCEEVECEECNDCSSPLDKEFPIDGELLQTVIELTADELIRTFASSLEDKTNDSSDSPAQQSK